MTKVVDIYLLKDGSDRQYIGRMSKSDVSFNRYNEGLLVAAGKIFNTNVQESVFLKFSAQFQEKAELEFKTFDTSYTGDFSFINFDEETQIVVFGSLGAITESTVTPARPRQELDARTVPTGFALSHAM
ncbi:hypothetical protein [Kordiimonas pumila]|uniref:Uncharacterized protein n=1 Tax=Kordiimonas pumila TaxID=2161677 RepID=A0ABV7CZV3_9PROT|nr:hypothetical protein [Kordiimonas pumila]